MYRPGWFAFLAVWASAIFAAWRLGDIKTRLDRAAKALDVEETLLIEPVERDGFQLARQVFRDAWLGVTRV